MRSVTEQSGYIYKELTFKRFLTIFLLTILCVVTSLLNLAIGSVNVEFIEIIKTLLGYSTNPVTQVTIWEYRIPWTLMALLVGGALGLAGLQMQTILNNPLASPYTLGISAGAGFGAALAYVLGIKLLPIELVVPVNAFIFALLTCLLIMFIGKIRGFTSETLVLGGIAISFLFQALLALLEYYASEETLQAIVFWLFGSLTKASLFKSQIIFCVLIIISVLLLLKAWKITALRLGDDRAKSLGINTERLRLEVLVYISILTSIAVCFVGIIGFVGLVAPHIARMLIGEDQRFLIIGSILSGALILSAGAIISKVIVPGAIFPVGIVTSILGIPFFLYLVIKGRGGIW
ncbi:MAG TPA: iron ABC transporter permease [Archaeoglobus profundus]|nr:iron ABC transporter permease [Archaeoglobus profundus]